jgi:hypothetical protein
LEGEADDDASEEEEEDDANEPQAMRPRRATRLTGRDFSLILAILYVLCCETREKGESER